MKSGSIQYEQANNIYSAEIKNGIKGALSPRPRMKQSSIAATNAALKHTYNMSVFSFLRQL